MPNGDRDHSAPADEARRATLIAELAKLDPRAEGTLADEGFATSSEASDGLLDWLQAWYESHCDDDWEHGYGVRIDTLDNPGWRVQIDLTGTALAGHTIERICVNHTETDWFHYWIEDDRFEAAGGAKNLTDILSTFRDWVEGNTT